MKKSLYLLLLTGFLSSCSQDLKEMEETTPASRSNALARIQSLLSAPEGDTLSPGDMQVSIISNSYKTKYGEFKGSFQTTGSIVDSPVDGDLVAGNYAFPVNNDIFYGSSSTDSHLAGEQENLFGQNVHIRLSGSSRFDDYSIDHYVPVFIDVQLDSYEDLFTGQDLLVRWQPDGHIAQNPVFVVIQYNPSLTFNENHPELPDAMITKIFEFRESDGHGVIPSSALSDLPVGGKVDLHIGRGNAQFHTVNSKTLYAFATNVTTVPGVLVK
jgi:hypothetical protein